MRVGIFSHHISIRNFSLLDSVYTSIVLCVKKKLYCVLFLSPSVCVPLSTQYNVFFLRKTMTFFYMIQLLFLRPVPLSFSSPTFIEYVSFRSSLLCVVLSSYALPPSSSSSSTSPYVTHNFFSFYINHFSWVFVSNRETFEKK